MIHLIHGNDSISSRKRLSELKSLYDRDSVVEFAIKDLDYSALAIVFKTVSMFAQKQVVVVEGKLDTKLADLAEINKSDVDLIIWVGDKLRSKDSLLTSAVKAGAKVELLEQKIDDRIFPFLDSVVQRNRLSAFKELQRLYQGGKEPIYINTMLVWQFRNLIVPENCSGLVKKKVDLVRNNFKFEELKKIYYLLLQTDVQLKSGEGPGEALIEEVVWKVTK